MNADQHARGPLAGIRVLELGGIGPVPHAGMLLADLGADVIRVDRVGTSQTPEGADVTRRGKTSVTLDIKDPRGLEAILQIADRVDVLLEGNRPGVMERLGAGPEECLRRNPKLVYGRMTGWGQTGPLSAAAGHDINYISIPGALRMSGQGGAPQFPLNLLGDYAGGSMYLVAGVMAALLEATRTGEGQVIDAAIVDGTSHLLSMAMGMRNMGMQQDLPGQSVLDGGAPFYSVYRTAEDEFVSVGAIEPQFFALLVKLTGIEFDLALQHDRSQWPHLRSLLTAVFSSETRSHWEKVFTGTDGCVAPVLTLAEAVSNEHMASRGAILETDGGGIQPGIAPRFSRHDSLAPRAVRPIGEDTARVIADLTDLDPEAFTSGRRATVSGSAL